MSDTSTDDTSSQEDDPEKRRKNEKAQIKLLQRTLLELQIKNERKAAEHRKNLERMFELQSRGGNHNEDSDMVKMAKIMKQKQVEFPDFRKSEYFEWRTEVNQFIAEDAGASTNGILMLTLKKHCSQSPKVGWHKCFIDEATRYL